MVRLRLSALSISLLLLANHLAWAQEVGTIAELDGSAEIGRGGVFSAMTLGAVVQQGDTLRTGRPGRLRVVFQDDSVLTMADDSEVVIAEQVFDRNAGVARSLLRLVQGKARALVSEYYERPKSSYRIETVTAVAGVRGTEFVITFDPVAEVSDVVGVSGRVEVHSVLDRVAHAVFITSKEITTVSRGAYPSKPRRLSDDVFRQYMEKLEFVGGGKPESIIATQPLLTGLSVPEPDRALAQTVSAVAPAATNLASTIAQAPAENRIDTRPDASNVIQQSPQVIESPLGRLGIRF